MFCLICLEHDVLHGIALRFRFFMPQGFLRLTGFLLNAPCSIAMEWKLRKGHIVKKLLLAAAALATLATSPAFAQYYGGPRPPPGYGRDYDDRRYDDRRRDRGPRYDDRRGPRGGRLCVTSRGACPTGYTLRPGTPCRCDIPGFGVKRGNVQ